MVFCDGIWCHLVFGDKINSKECYRDEEAIKFFMVIQSELKWWPYSTYRAYMIAYLHLPCIICNKFFFEILKEMNKESIYYDCKVFYSCRWWGIFSRHRKSSLDSEQPEVGQEEFIHCRQFSCSVSPVNIKKRAMVIAEGCWRVFVSLYWMKHRIISKSIL